MAIDYKCTLWFDGWPKWMGGSGKEWLHCCVDHDLGSSHFEMAQCISQVSPLMAIVMFVGVAGPLGLAYRAFQKYRSKRV